MPSLLKTAFLELSKWAGNEYPKREDFVSDNEKIDAFADDISSQMAQRVNKTGDTMTGSLIVEGSTFIDQKRDISTDAYRTRLATDSNGNGTVNVFKNDVLSGKLSITNDGKLKLGTHDVTAKEVALKESPLETLITTGFASGWSGEIRCSKTQEGIINIKIISLTKSSAIATIGETIITLPVGFRPLTTERKLFAGHDSNGVRIVGSVVDIGIQPNGMVVGGNTGSVTSGVVKITNGQLFAL